jgi:hypothetical protein
MAKEIVVVPESQEEALFSCLRDLGFSVGTPASGDESGWTEAGERRVSLNMESILAGMFRLGAGLQLWKSDREDLFLVRDPEGKTIRASLDGYSAAEANEILKGLTSHGIVFEIDYE